MKHAKGLISELIAHNNVKLWNTVLTWHSIPHLAILSYHVISLAILLRKLIEMVCKVIV